MKIQIFEIYKHPEKQAVFKNEQLILNIEPAVNFLKILPFKMRVR